MRLARLRMLNWRQHADSTIEFSDGVVGIIGSNGSGKSSVLECITWCLFGAGSIRGSTKSIRWDRASARRGASADLAFEIGGKAYEISRGETDASLVEVESGSIVASGTTAVNEAIPKLIGLTLREFEASFLCEQKQLARIASMSPVERQQFFRSVLGIGRLDEAVKAARQSKNDLARERDGLSMGLGSREPLAKEAADAGEALGNVKDSLVGIRRDAEIAGFEALKAERALEESREKLRRHEQLSEQLIAARQALSLAEKQRDSVEEKVVLALAAQQRVEAEAWEIGKLPELRKAADQMKELRGAQQQRESLQRTIGLAEEQIAGFVEVLADCKRRIALHDQAVLDDAVETLEKENGELDRLRNERLAKRSAAQERCRAASAEDKRLRQSIAAVEAVGAEGACPVCTQTLGAHFDTVVNGLRHQREDRLVDYEVADAEYRRLEDFTEEERLLGGDVVQLRKKVDDLRALAFDAQYATVARKQAETALMVATTGLQQQREKLASLPSDPFDAEALSALEVAISRLEAQEAALQADRVLAGQVESLRENHLNWIERIRQGGQRVDSLEAQITQIGYDAQAFEVAKAVAHLTTVGATNAQSALARAESELISGEQRHQRATASLAEYDRKAEQLAELSAKVQTIETAALRLADFRVSMASQIRPELEELVSGFVSILTDGRFEAATLSEDFSVELYRSGVSKEVISGGEEDVVAVAMRLATAQMIEERSGHPLGLLVLDEPFGSQDECRRNNMMALFRRLQGVFPQILLISHVPEIQNEVDRAVMVEFDEGAGCSKVYELAGVGA